MDIEEMFNLLSKLNLNPEYEAAESEVFKRVIKFKVNNQEYNIVWFHNISTLYIGNHKNYVPRIPFRYIYLDKHYPISGDCLGFSPTKLERKSIMDREYPFEVIRIPLKLQK